MSHAPRPATAYSSASTSTKGGSTMNPLRPPSQSALLTRINAKRMELENLRALRDLSGNLAAQLAELEAKLRTLKDGTQSVALVLANWDNVLRAIHMAARKVLTPSDADDARPEADQPGESSGTTSTPPDIPARELPVPLVRIPVRSQSAGG